ncbi:hypothetical protein [Actinacidiphila bryophytorum]|nr:hypothetical protein [Actinacidiphila bryophytorum]UWE11175.1 hypothetical protein NYE86_22305 [Actinacidiphila bryophytorum]
MAASRPPALSADDFAALYRELAARNGWAAGARGAGGADPGKGRGGGT